MLSLNIRTQDYLFPKLVLLVPFRINNVYQLLFEAAKTQLPAQYFTRHTRQYIVFPAQQIDHLQVPMMLCLIKYFWIAASFCKLYIFVIPNYQKSQNLKDFAPTWISAWTPTNSIFSKIMGILVLNMCNSKRFIVK